MDPKLICLIRIQGKRTGSISNLALTDFIKNCSDQKILHYPKKIRSYFYQTKFKFKEKNNYKKKIFGDLHDLKRQIRIRNTEPRAHVISQNMNVLDWEKGSYISLAVLTGIFVDIYKML